MRLNTVMPLRDMTANGDNTLTILENGDYEVSYNILLNTSRAATAAVGVRRNAP